MRALEVWVASTLMHHAVMLSARMQKKQAGMLLTGPLAAAAQRRRLLCSSGRACQHRRCRQLQVLLRARGARHLYTPL